MESPMYNACLAQEHHAQAQPLKWGNIPWLLFMGHYCGNRPKSHSIPRVVVQHKHVSVITALKLQVHEVATSLHSDTTDGLNDKLPYIN